MGPVALVAAVKLVDKDKEALSLAEIFLAI